jgi:hypothetical protein
VSHDVQGSAGRHSGAAVEHGAPERLGQVEIHDDHEIELLEGRRGVSVVPVLGEIVVGHLAGRREMLVPVVEGGPGDFEPLASLGDVCVASSR